ncbi:MAG: tRNA (adenosine(37)-N6)-dimethylallyltransferase MiaA [Patescibacteria group bacterium]|nr:tRNA (adenosine(37)-N6)-dimethylallyltransferase MiaA [Patescibacteria group bacterium]
MQRLSNKVVVVVGPNASGKTKLAVCLARHFNGEIISADSRQVYRGMDIGTGKDLAAYGGKAKSAKRKAQKDRVAYHLIDVASPRSQFSVADFQRSAYRAIDDILRRKKLPIICGGTGLYVDAVVQGFRLPKSRITNQELRRIRKRLAQLSNRQLLRTLRQVDPATYRTIDRKNLRRVQRALEIYYASGKPKSAQLEKIPPPYKFLQLGVAVPRPVLHQRIALRLRERFDEGMIREVRRLHRQGVSWNKLDAFGLEYRWISRYLQGKIDRDTMEQRLGADIKHYARRQMTWFRRNQKIYWISGLRSASALVKDFLE